MNIFRTLSNPPAFPTPLYGFGNDSDHEKIPAGPKSWFYILLLVAFFVSGYYFFVMNSGLLRLELETDTRTVLKVYWPNRHGDFSERNMTQLTIKPGQSNYAVRVNNTAAVDRLRLDPSEKPAGITIKSLTIRQWGYPDYHISNQQEFEHLQIISGVETLTRNEQGVTVQIKSGDPQLQLLLPSMEKEFSPFTDMTDALRILCLVLLAAAGYLVFRPLLSGSDFIPVLAASALALILVMAYISAFNSHPDEYVHTGAGEYFAEHNLPPKVGDPAIKDTYSHYGFSRLHSGEIVYLVAGKYLQLLQPLYLESFFLLRLFNVLLFASLLLYAFNKPDFRFFLLPFLMSSQIWYIYSYFNSDAFATFIGLLAAYQFAGQKSALTSLIFGDRPRHAWLKIFLLGLLFGLLLLLKRNFYSLYLFFFLYFIWRLWVLRPGLTKRGIFRIFAVVLTGCILFAGVRVVDAWVNDFNKDALVFEARQKYADRLFNPDTPIEKRHAYLQMRERGTSLKHFLEADRWGEKSFRTSFGVYGYTQYSGSFSYYNYVRYIGIALLLTLTLSVLYRGRREGMALLAVSGGTALLLIVVACWHAWTVKQRMPNKPILVLAAEQSQVSMLTAHTCCF
ncbi:MAG: hypothetical protein D3924_08050 [Candidatus Electrothrix sp. AR4]|nr:hypothetical protein [Candidatus Electrothrix sp. AR4]